MNDFERLFQDACEAHKAGNINNALELYRRVLEKNPNHAPTFYNAGIIKYSSGALDDAAELLRKAIVVAPDVANYHIALAIVYNDSGKTDSAINSYRKSLEIENNNVIAWNNLGQIYIKRQDTQSAKECFLALLSYDPNNFIGHLNVGAMLIRQGHFSEAIPYLLTANEIKPDDPGVTGALGNAYFHIKDYSKASVLLKKFLDINPGAHAERLKLAEILLARAHYSRAESEFKMLVDKDEEISKNALFGLARTYATNGQLNEAADCYLKALDIDPKMYEVWHRYLFLISYNSMLTPDDTLKAHMKWNEAINGDEKSTTFHWPRASDHVISNRKLKIGYISGDFSHHPVGYLFEPLLRNHDNERFDTYCYSSATSPDDMTQKIKEAAANWRSIENLEFRSLAEMIHDDEIDIMIDLSGHSGNTRLMSLAYRPAPVQASYLGYCTTTGLTAMDYWITDWDLHPEDTTELATENILRLPRCWLTYQPPEHSPAVNIRSGDQICFGSFNQISKISSNVISVWAEIMKSVPGSTILIKNKQLIDEYLREEIYEKFAGNGIARERVELQEAKDHYMGTYHNVDIALDTFPRTGGVTTLDALWMGVPVITMAGKRFIERQGCSILAAIGRQEWIAESEQDYIKKVVALANKRSERSDIRRKLRSDMQNSSLLDAKSLATSLESAYSEMWNTYLGSIEKSMRN